MSDQLQPQHQERLADLDELLTACAREWARRAAERGLLFFYDFRGPSFAVATAADIVADIARTLLNDAIEALSSGCILFSVDVIPHLEQATVRLQCAHTGQEASRTVVRRLMTLPEGGQGAQVSGLATRSGADTNSEAEHRAARQCESLQGTLLIGRLPGEGRVARAEILLPYEQLQTDLTAARAHGLCTWLIGEPAVAFDDIGRRLQRLGWDTILIPSVAAALARFGSHPASHAEIGLILGAEGLSVTLGELSQLAALLPGDTQAQVALLCRASHSVHTGGRIGGVLMLEAPLDPRQLHQMTERALARVNRRLRLLSNAASAQAQRPRALIAEDNLVNQLISTEMLKLLGFDVDVANNGEEAVRSCVQNPPALVLMDLDMPVLSGLEATQQLRELQRQGSLPWLPIIAATARTTAQDRQQAQQAGVNGFLEKPIDMALLHAEIQRVMSRDAGVPTGPNRP